MKAIILNATAWMIVPVMDAFAKYLSSSMDVLQITWARYFFTVVFTLSLMLIFYRQSLVWTKKPALQLIRGLIFVFSTYLFFYAISEISLPKALTLAFVAPICVTALSPFFLKEKVSIKKWVLIFISFFGIILLGFDPLIRNEIFALFLITLMAFFYASAQVFSRYLKDLEVTLTNAVMGLVGFVLLIISSSIFEGQTINEIKNISFQSWLLILHSGIFVSIAAHMSMFYLYRMYPVNRVFPFYALFPVFGVLLTFIIFYEIPTLITFIGGVIVIVATYFINKEN